MSIEAHELAEKIEHLAEHGDGHGGGSLGKRIGVTMATLGVMLAFCAALVGSHRTELTAKMVEQAHRWGTYQAETTKLRAMEADYEMLSSLTPKPDEVKKVEDTLRTKRAAAGAKEGEDAAEVKDLVASATEDMADLLTPDPEEKDRFRKMSARYAVDVKEARENAEAFEAAIHAHERAAEWYERAQLAAEIGIVVASVALLVGSRALWAVSILMGLACAGIGGATFVRTDRDLDAAAKQIAQAEKREAAMEKDDDDDGDDTSSPEHAVKPAHDAKPEAKPKAAPATHDGR